MRNVVNWGFKHTWASAIIIMVVIQLPYAILYYASSTERTVIVYEKWARGGHGTPNYFFSDMYGNVYSIENSHLLLKYDAEERYTALQEDETYAITTYGWRIKCLGYYPNAIKIELIGYD